MSYKRLLIFLLLIPISFLAKAQEIELGTWRTHYSYSNVQLLTETPERIYGASTWGFFYVDKEEGNPQVLSTLQGLSETGVSALASYTDLCVVLAGYRSGGLDVLGQGQVRTLTQIRDNANANNKTIRAFARSGRGQQGDTLFVGTDYGITLYRLPNFTLGTSYLNLGSTGQRIPVRDIAVHRDTIYAVTSEGIISNTLNGSRNLNDFATWFRYTFSAGNPPQGVERVGSYLYIATTSELFRREDGSWRNLPAPPNLGNIVQLRADAAQQDLVLTTTSGVWRYSAATQTYTALTQSNALQANSALVSAEGRLWVGDRRQGLVLQEGSAFTPLSPDGPLYDELANLAYGNEQLLALPGEQFSPQNYEGFSSFAAGRWTNYTSANLPNTVRIPEAYNLTAAAFNPTDRRWYLASLSSGILAWQPTDDSFTLYNSTTTQFQLRPDFSGDLEMTGIGVDQTGQVWASQYGAATQLYRYTPATNEWVAELQNNITASNNRGLLVPNSNDVWVILNNENSLQRDAVAVFNPDKEVQLRYLGERAGNGSFTDNEVYALAQDVEGAVWIGLNDGVNYLVNPYGVLTQNRVDASLPVYQQRALLDETRVTTIAVDGGNRKWMGTANGVFVVGDAGDTLYNHFTTSNSPLPSNHIRALAIQQQTGEVFIATDRGLVSYRSGSTAGTEVQAETIKVFPNPVRLGYTGLVGISGLVRDASVKITNTAGFLVRELPAEGGTAAWDQRNSNGQLVSPGVYLIFIANFDGSESLAGKVAIVR